MTTSKDRAMFDNLAQRTPYRETGFDMDRATSRTVCSAVGERLRQFMPAEPAELPSHLQGLLDQMRRLER